MKSGMCSALNTSMIKEQACRLGFDLAGVAPAKSIETEAAYYKYLQHGYHGAMEYLKRDAAKRIDPRLVLPGGRSIICLAINYYNRSPSVREKSANEDEAYFGKIARYAWGREYHGIVKDKLNQLREYISSMVGKARYFCCVDSGPLVEKAHAVRAGLGWIGKNGLVVNETYGSWLVLGEIVTDIELQYDKPVESQCGECTKCLEVCPTGALVEPYVLDGRRCIAYFNSVKKARMPAESAGKTDAWLLGCDVCQDVCPFNQDVPVTDEEGFKLRTDRVDIDAVLSMDNKQFKERFADSSIGSVGLEHFQQTAGNCRGNLVTKSANNP